MIDKIQCPSCSFEFDVEDALAGKLQAEFKAKADKELRVHLDRVNSKESKLAKEKEDFEKKKERENELFQERLNKALNDRVADESRKIELKTKESYELKLKLLAEENAQKKAENLTLKSKEIEILKKERFLKEQTEELEHQIQKQLLEKQQEIEDKARQKEREKNQLKELEYQKKLEDQKKLIDEMKRKAEQGSMQLQGEVQELALEDLLRSSYPFDNIVEVPKGVRGADCIQEVVNSSQDICGTIVYESKRTKNFASNWIDKIKQDQVQCKADLAVIVTQTFPQGMSRFGLKNGVWLCTFNEVQSVSLVLREILVKTKAVQSAETNKGDKMELLYNYLTSNEFVQNIQRIVENYDEMHSQLASEKRAMMKIWSQREKQIWVVQENLSSLFGSIKGIAGNQLSSTQVMELKPHSDQ